MCNLGLGKFLHHKFSTETRRIIWKIYSKWWAITQMAVKNVWIESFYAFYGVNFIQQKFTCIFYWYSTLQFIRMRIHSLFHSVVVKMLPFGRPSLNYFAQQQRSGCRSSSDDQLSNCIIKLLSMAINCLLYKQPDCLPTVSAYLWIGNGQKGVTKPRFDRWIGQINPCRGWMRWCWSGKRSIDWPEMNYVKLSFKPRLDTFIRGDIIHRRASILKQALQRDASIDQLKKSIPEHIHQLV